MILSNVNQVTAKWFNTQICQLAQMSMCLSHSSTGNCNEVYHTTSTHTHTHTHARMSPGLLLLQTHTNIHTEIEGERETHGKATRGPPTESNRSSSHQSRPAVFIQSVWLARAQGEVRVVLGGSYCGVDLDYCVVSGLCVHHS